MKHDAIIIGGGAAGLFCAYQAAKLGSNVVVLDHNLKLGRKIKISGGSKCNFTNRNITAQHYLCPSPYFPTAALKNYPPEAFLDLIKQYGTTFYEKELGQLFTTQGSDKILQMLLDLCKEYEVALNYPEKIQTVRYDDEVYNITTNKQRYQAKNLVIATGGLSFPGLGASGFGYNIAKQFGHKVTPCKPALVGLTLAEPQPNLSGMAIPASVRCDKQTFNHQVLWTHQGLSGPAILQISSYWQQGKELIINWLPEYNITEEIKQASPKVQLSKFLGKYFPTRFVQFLLDTANIASKPLAELGKKQILLLEELIHRHKIIPKDTTGYEKAEVTKGGVDVSQISAKSMESKIQNGLYFIGEVLDVTGHLGGYNFQWAWSSATMAAEHIAKT